MAGFRLGRTIVAILLFASLPMSFAGPCLAQDIPQDLAQMFASDRNVPIEPLLRSQDQRLVALGAWEVGKRPDDRWINLLEQMVESWDPALQSRGNYKDSYDAMSVVLDTLIQLNIEVPSVGISAIADTFPTQALILVTRLPVEDAEPLLRSWYESGRSYERSRPDFYGTDRMLRARVSAMMLAKNRAEGFAAGILEDSVVWMSVSVPNAGALGQLRCLVNCYKRPVCAGEFSEHPRVGWPQLYQYIFDENVPPEADAMGTDSRFLLVEAGGDRITYRRVHAEGDRLNCYLPAPLNAVNRHRLLAEMLGVNLKQTPWPMQEDVLIPWENDRQFKQDLADEVRKEEEKLQAGVQAVYKKGLLTRTEASITRPRLTVHVFDDRETVQPVRMALPHPAAMDSRTSFTVHCYRCTQ